MIVIAIPAVILLTRKDDCSKPTPKPLPRNDSEYQSNSDYYNQLAVHDFTQADNLRVDRLSSPQFHPDNGKSVIYLRKQYHMPDSNGSSTTLHWLDLATNKTIQLTQPVWGINDQQYFWVKKNAVLFLSNRALSGLNQIFQLNLPDDISTVTKFIEPVQITDYPLDIDNLLVNRQATQLAFSCQVFANLSIQETVSRLAAQKATGVSAYTFDKLFIRHWDEFMLGRRNHPFVVAIGQIEKGKITFSSDPVDVLFPVDSDSPTRPFGGAKPQWAFNAGGTKFAFTRQHDETSAVAWSTNLDIYTVDLPATKGVAPVCITCDNLAADTDPSFSPVDDNVLVYRAQAIPGYESDQFKIKLYNGQFA